MRNRRKAILKSARSRTLNKRCNSENQFEEIQNRLNELEVELKLCSKNVQNKK